MSLASPRAASARRRGGMVEYGRDRSSPCRAWILAANPDQSHGGRCGVAAAAIDVIVTIVAVDGIPPRLKWVSASLVPLTVSLKLVVIASWPATSVTVIATPLEQ